MPRLTIFFLVFTLACSRQGVIIEPVSEDFTVEVSTDGRRVHNFEQQLVHRVELPLGLAREAHYKVVKLRQLPLKVRIERDHSGGISGARVLSPVSSTSMKLGLKPRDLLTAVGTTRITNLENLGELFSTLVESKQATMTIIRQGRPNKFLYYVSN